MIKNFFRSALAFLALWAFFSGLLFLAGALTSVAHGDTYYHNLERVITNNGVVRDTFLTREKVRGFIAVHDACIHFSANFNSEPKTLKDQVEVLNVRSGGLTYDVQSSISGRKYTIQFLKGADSLILLIPLEDRSIVLLKFKRVTLS